MPINPRLVRSFAVKPRAFGTPLRGVGTWPLAAGKSTTRSC